MENKRLYIWIGAGALILLLVVIGLSILKQGQQDRAALGAQRAALEAKGLGRPQGGPGGQMGPGGPGGPGGMDQMLSQLNLTSDQQAQIKALESQRPQPSPGQSPDQMRSQMDAYMAKVDAILTPEQRARMPRPPAGSPPGQSSPLSQLSPTNR